MADQPAIDYSIYPKPQQAFERKVDAILAENPDAKDQAEQLLSSAGELRIVTITPAIAAAIHRYFNSHNRDFSIYKATDYGNAMKRLEWRLNHQGMAAYENGTLEDGQHRCGGIVLSEMEQKFWLHPNQPMGIIDTVDQQKPRNAGQALEMAGVKDGKLKASIAKTAMAYNGEVEYGSAPRLSEIQIEKWVIGHDKPLREAIQIGRGSVRNVTEPCQTEAEASTVALLMILGNYPPMIVSGFMASIQQGVSTYPEAPTLELSRRLLKAKHTEAKRDKLPKKEKLALCAKAASLWTQKMSVSKIRWNPSKESLVPFEAPIEHPIEEDVHGVVAQQEILPPEAVVTH